MTQIDENYKHYQQERIKIEATQGHGKPLHAMYTIKHAKDRKIPRISQRNLYMLFVFHEQENKHAQVQGAFVPILILDIYNNIVLETRL